MILFDWNPESRSPAPVRGTSFSYSVPYPPSGFKPLGGLITSIKVCFYPIKHKPCFCFYLIIIKMEIKRYLL